jgi:hypothetical protein
MKAISLKSLNTQLNKSFLEMLLSIYVVLGALTGIPILSHTFYFVGILVVFSTYILLYRMGSFSRKMFIVHFEILIVIFGILLGFLFGDVPFNLIFTRIMTLLCIFGITICFTPELNIDISNVLRLIRKYLLFISIVMFIDIMIQKIVDIGIWKPITYLGYRYSGPFYDSNYAAVYLGCTLLLVILGGGYKVGKKVFFATILLLDIFFCGSLTTFLGLFITFLMMLFLKKLTFCRIIYIHIIFLFMYVFILCIWHSNQELFYDAGIEILSKVYHDGAEAKYISLQMRFAAQYKALEIGVKNFWGEGPHQLVPQLGRDTHNSFFSIFFEEGYLGMLLIMLSLKFQARKICKLAKSMVIFVTISIFMLDIHYTTVYTILLFVIQLENTIGAKLECEYKSKGADSNERN